MAIVKKTIKETKSVKVVENTATDHRTYNVEVRKETILNRGGKDLAVVTADDKNEGVGSITLLSNTVTAIINMKGEAFMTISTLFMENAFQEIRETILEETREHEADNKKELPALKVADLEGVFTGVSEYKGLPMQVLEFDEMEMDLSFVSKEIEIDLIKEMVGSDFTKENNLRKMFTDINCLCRMYQELGIDAAKKLYKVLAWFYTKDIRALSTQHVSKSFEGFKTLVRNANDAIEEGTVATISEYLETVPAFISRNVESSGLEVGEFFYDEKGNIEPNPEDEQERMYFQDDMAAIQDAAMEFSDEIIRENILTAYMNAKVSDAKMLEIKTSLTDDKIALVRDLQAMVRAPYGALIGSQIAEMEAMQERVNNGDAKTWEMDSLIESHKIAKEDMKSELGCLARTLTSDISVTRAGEAMYLTSLINSGLDNALAVQGLKLDGESDNSIHLTVAGELYMAYAATADSEDGCENAGYVLNGLTDGIEENEEIEFANGIAVDGHFVQVDSDFTGKLTAKTINGKLHAVKSIVEMIEEQRSEPMIPYFINVKLQDGCVDFDAYLEGRVERIREREASRILVEDAISIATKIELAPVFTAIDGTIIYNAFVATIDGIEVPVATYIAFSEIAKELLGGLYTEATELGFEFDMTVGGIIFKMPTDLRNESVAVLDANNDVVVEATVVTQSEIKEEAVDASVVTSVKKFTPNKEDKFVPGSNTGLEVEELTVKEGQLGFDEEIVVNKTVETEEVVEETIEETNEIEEATAEDNSSETVATSVKKFSAENAINANKGFTPSFAGGLDANETLVAKKTDLAF